MLCLSYYDRRNKLLYLTWFHVMRRSVTPDSLYLQHSAGGDSEQFSPTRTSTTRQSSGIKQVFSISYTPITWHPSSTRFLLLSCWDRCSNTLFGYRLWERLGFIKAGCIPRAGRLKRKDGNGEEYWDAWVFYKSFIDSTPAT